MKVVITVIIAILAVLIYGSVATVIKLKKELIQNKSVLSEKTDSIRYYRTDNGKLVAEKSAALLSTKDVSDSYPQVVAQLKEIDIRLKNMKAFMQSSFQANGSGTGIINNHYYVDSTGRRVAYKEFSMHDGYLSFRTTLYDSTVQSTYEYSYTDTISTVIHSKKKWFFGDEKIYATSLLKNPNAKVTGTTNLLIDTHKDKRFYVGVGASYSPLTNTFAPSVHVGYALFKF